MLISRTAEEEGMKMQMNMTESPVVRLKDAAPYLGISPGTLNALRREPGFPGVCELGARSKGILKRDLDEWLESRRRSA